MASETGLEIAVIGMAGRFPGARDIDQLWRNLCAGVESIRFFSEEEMLAAAVPPADLADPSYVRARGMLEGGDLFDAAFFGFSPREARITDPQHRLFLECAWQALEDAGHDTARESGAVGVYAGSSMNGYLAHLFADRRLVGELSVHQILIGNDKDYLAPRVSYKLGLEGPSVVVQTACSSSLVAVHIAVQALLNGECDLALAGGVSARLPEKVGYRYQEGMILSPDGHCRAFSAGAQGTVTGDGVGIVVLRRLEDALAAGDSIYAVLKGSAVNNDGAQKVGFTAPRIEGQARVIRAAQLMAEIEADSITYVEGHGTGTPLGDPIEVAALTRAFRATTDARTFCALGSIKTNIGHLDAAAGVAGLIKTALALHHRRIPPSLYFDRPNPQMDLPATPFYVNTELSDWPAGSSPRRAAVSSFGIGGTNAHVVLEEAPPRQAAPSSRPWQLLVLSARTETALDRATENLAAHLERHPELDLADVAYTCQVGRRELPHRRTLVVSCLDDALAALRSPRAGKVFEGQAGEQGRPVAFLFPGQGAQHPGMGAELHATEPAFRREMDVCREILAPLLGFNPLELLTAADQREASRRLDQTSVAQPLLFAVEVALARLLGEWGLRPRAMIGHSVGEYVAACLAGVFSLEEGLALLAARGRLIEALPRGSMLAVPLAPAELEPFLPGRGLVIAAFNGPARSVVSGPVEAVLELEEELSGRGIQCRKLHTSHAFHSPAMEPAAGAFAAEVAKVRLQTPQVPYLSNVTGTWIRAEEATDPGYWVDHLRQPVRFSDGLAEILRDSGTALLEVGPGDTLATLARKHLDRGAERLVLSSLPHPRRPGSEAASLLVSLGRLWAAGTAVEWSGYWVHERRGRVHLPTYPFERQSYRVAPPSGEALPDSAGSELADWFSSPVWSQALPARSQERAEEAPDGCWLVFVDACGLGEKIVERLARDGCPVVSVEIGAAFGRSGDRFTLAPGRSGDYDALFAALRGEGCLPGAVVHCWSVTRPARGKEPLEGLEGAEERGFWSLLYLAQALGRQRLATPLRLAVVSDGLHRIAGEPAPAPGKATLLGPCQVIPREYPSVTCQSIDILLPEARGWEEEALVTAILDEMAAVSPAPLVAYRGNSRWVRSLEPFRLEAGAGRPEHPRDGGVYLITGGLGAIGLAFAEHLARQTRVKLVLISRSGLPQAEAGPTGEPAPEPDNPDLPGLFTATTTDDRGYVRHLERELADAERPRDLEACGDLVPRLDALCASHVLAYLATGGLRARGCRITRRDLRQALGILPKFQRFYDYMLGLLAEDGILETVGDDLVLLRDLGDLGAPAELHRDIAVRYPEFSGLFDQLAHCAEGYADALCGRIEGIGVLYPEGDRKFLEETGRRTAEHGRRSLYCRLTAELVACLAERRPTERLRVLEVGAGTGSLTRLVVGRLAGQGHQVEYHLTDIGRAFLLQAERQAADQGLDFLRFGPLDITRDPVAQGYEEGSFDLILALDVVHATPDVVATTRNLARLLVPGGALWMVERVRSRRWVSLIWGLAEGWWYFDDGKRRGQPLVGIADWEEVLREAGFVEVAGHPGDSEGRERSDYALVTARRTPLETATGGQDRAQERALRVRRLESLGAEVLVCKADVSDFAAMSEAVAAARRRFGRIDGVLHAAGLLGAGVIQRKEPAAAAAVLAPKVRGTLILDRLLRDEPLDFFLLCSSTSSLTGTPGQVDYCAANAFLDLFAQWSRLDGGRPVTAINWERWTEVGMAVAAARSSGSREEVPEAGGAVDHPLLARCLHQGESRAIFASCIGAAEVWALDEHRLLGRPVLPGTAYLEMARAALEEIEGEGGVELRDVLFWSPLVVPDGEMARVFTVLDRMGEGFSFQILSAVEGKELLRRHASGTLLRLSASLDGREGFQDRLEQLRRVPAVVSERGGDHGFGPRWNSLWRCHIQDDEALGELRLGKEFAGDLERFKLHPALLDVATGVSGSWRNGGFHVPLSYRALRMRAPLVREVTTYTRSHRSAGQARETLVLDVWITDREGRSLVEVEGFTKRRVETSSRGEMDLAAGRLRALSEEAGGHALVGAEQFPEILAILWGAPGANGPGIRPAEGVEAFRRILSGPGLPQIVVSTRGHAPARRMEEDPAPAARASLAKESRKEASSRPAVPVHEAAPGSVEAVLARVWCEVLGLDQVGPEDNFFDLGGDSILGLQVMARAREAGLQIAPSQIFELQTIAELAGALRAAEASVEPARKAPEEVPAAADFPLVRLDDEKLGKLLRRLDEIDALGEAGE